MQYNILFVYPKCPDTYWSFSHALKFISKKAANPPLGLLTVAALVPDYWEKKLIDLNVTSLKDKDLLWADYVFISAMSIQQDSAVEIIKRCKALGKKTVAGGPLFTELYEEFEEVDHLVLNEAEITLPEFLNDLENGSPKKIYRTTNYASIDSTPIPDYSLIKHSRYAFMGIQYSRGCPFNCEFCDITALFGNKVRTKTSQQIIAELDSLLALGWRGNVFFVDDNFIGDKHKLKTDLLPAMHTWMKKHHYPFNFSTEASINLADDEKLMKMLVTAGFSKVFVGIETTEDLSLAECNKKQNRSRDLIQSVKTIQTSGIEVSAGFIVGFDNDTPSVFQHQIDFIQRSGIITAMVGLLNAPKKTRLYERLENEGRITNDWSGDNTNYSLNFIPKMNLQDLMNGYQKIIQGVYSAKAYYQRVMSFLKKYNPPMKEQKNISFIKLIALFKSMMIIGVINKNRKYYWGLFFWSLFTRPKVFPLAVTYSIYGYHYRKVFKDLC
jgi:radical SAM superfamily enzyme YgiQ (UPF0313 family)